MQGYSAQQVRDAEKPLLARGVPLMARAARALATTIWQLLSDDNAESGPVLVLAGPGNNGGDALFAAAELASKGVDVAIAPVAKTIHGAGLNAALSAGARLIASTVDDAEAVAEAVTNEAAEVRVVVDGILGTGSAGNPALRGNARATVRALIAQRQAQHQPFQVVAVDVPSGLDPDSGEAPDQVVLPATVTVTFGVCKAGLLRTDGPRLAGRVEVIDIGLTPQLEGVKPVYTTI